MGGIEHKMAKLCGCEAFVDIDQNKLILDKKYDMKVELVEFESRKYILKTFDKEKIMESDSRTQEIVNERDLLK